jgi:ABC-type dipeptide/oligopeptide/nickel transport system ATPase component
MAEYGLIKWKKYLSVEDYNYLTQFVDNIRNDVRNDKMIILCGSSGRGKTTLQNDIYKYLLKDTWEDSHERQILLENEKLLSPREPFNPKSSYPSFEIRKKFMFYFLKGNNFFPRKDNKMLKILIKNSFFKSRISVTDDIEKVNKELLDISRIIKMEHVFTKLK